MSDSIICDNCQRMAYVMQSDRGLVAKCFECGWEKVIWKSR
jgi:hypothetical protein